MNQRLHWAPRFRAPTPLGRLMIQTMLGAQALAPVGVRGVRIATRRIHWNGHTVSLRILRPAEATPRGVYIDYHGGGWAIGTASMDDQVNAAHRARLQPRRRQRRLHHAPRHHLREPDRAGRRRRRLDLHPCRSRVRRARSLHRRRIRRRASRRLHAAAPARHARRLRPPARRRAVLRSLRSLLHAQRPQRPARHARARWPRHGPRPREASCRIATKPAAARRMSRRSTQISRACRPRCSSCGTIDPLIDDSS